MNKDDFKDLAQIRLREANALLKNGRYEGAYYLCGYAIECGLKACIAKKTKRYDFPDKKTVIDSYKHDLSNLVGTAGLELKLDKEIEKNAKFEVNWGIVKDWSVVSRYEKHNEKEARDLFSAVSNKKDGVFQWIKKYW